ncbi:MAG: hypothetical protein JXB38_22715 [Anaerolineales bacterium]|nr:hypothetical protein [Anaerolineales bacterium]
MDFRIFGPEDQKPKLEKQSPEKGSSFTAQSLVPRQLQTIFKKMANPFSGSSKTENANLQEGAN